MYGSVRAALRVRYRTGTGGTGAGTGPGPGPGTGSWEDPLAGVVGTRPGTVRWVCFDDLFGYNRWVWDPPVAERYMSPHEAWLTKIVLICVHPRAPARTHRKKLFLVSYRDRGVSKPVITYLFSWSDTSSTIHTVARPHRHSRQRDTSDRQPVHT